ncbi:PepSY-associated TM helix domain-containing protein [Asticcacaulis sp. SL142]|uniref:PepSY-associated TM helix domain-containing protein n=1 Tax=Asticcacaulis sp. SL142 TaxID=2995155 RepID=UPI00226CB510|nr:PepSY-associated TM helix domain-containing protein [Asticcacaulis sp. SL142]WAC46961.1 PepSY-associated TM helix domain-containing protein [Asticcacaulis sp. SL142]
MSSFSGLGASFWRNQLRQWHWISSAVCLMAMFLFSVTGYTLNHATDIEAKPKIDTKEVTLTPNQLTAFDGAQDKADLPVPAVHMILESSGIDVEGYEAEVSEGEIYIPMPKPGVDSWVSIERDTGLMTYERTDRGVIAILNDLHKGRNSGPAWSWFIDIIALFCVIFCLTGFGLLWVYAKSRAITWPLIGFGVLAPFILFMVFVH